MGMAGFEPTPPEVMRNPAFATNYTTWPQNLDPNCTNIYKYDTSSIKPGTSIALNSRFTIFGYTNILTPGYAKGA